LDANYDAATALLVMHFLPDDGSKLDFLQAMAAALKPGGLLLLADLGGQHGEADFERLFGAWRLQQQGTRARQDLVELDFGHLVRNVHPISAERRAVLFESAGFTAIGEYWRAYGLAATLCRKVNN
jgi:tRNA (cmo5U34)-methyltransferase